MKKIDKRKLTKKFIYENAKKFKDGFYDYYVTLNEIDILVNFRENQGYYCPVRSIEDENVNEIHIYFPWDWKNESGFKYDHAPNKIIHF